MNFKNTKSGLKKKSTEKDVVSIVLKHLIRDSDSEAQVINMKTLRNSKHPWVLYETEVPHSRFW